MRTRPRLQPSRTTRPNPMPHVRCLSNGHYRRVEVTLRILDVAENPPIVRVIACQSRRARVDPLRLVPVFHPVDPRTAVPWLRAVLRPDEPASTGHVARAVVLVNNRPAGLPGRDTRLADSLVQRESVPSSYRTYAKGLVLLVHEDPGATDPFIPKQNRNQLVFDAVSLGVDSPIASLCFHFAVALTSMRPGEIRFCAAVFDGRIVPTMPRGKNLPSSIRSSDAERSRAETPCAGRPKTRSEVVPAVRARTVVGHSKRSRADEHFVPVTRVERRDGLRGILFKNDVDGVLFNVDPNVVPSTGYTRERKRSFANTLAVRNQLFLACLELLERSRKGYGFQKVGTRETPSERGDLGLSARRESDPDPASDATRP